MNFFTSTSNRSAIGIFVLFTVLFLFVSTFALKGIDQIAVGKSYFIEHKLSKALHMKKYVEKSHNDIIFIGNSKVQNHISSAMFKAHGLDIYTFGVPSITLSDYPYMVEQAIETHPKAITLKISVTDLYVDEHLPPIRQPTVTDFLGHIKSGNIPASPFNVLDFFPIKFYASRYARLYESTPEKVGEGMKKLIAMYGYHPDCEIFCVRGNARKVSICTNGNGTVWYHTAPSGHSETIPLSDFNDENVKLLRYLMQVIQERGIKAYVVLEAVFDSRKYLFDAAQVARHLGIDKSLIVDATQLKFSDDEWADAEHVNGKGKERITTFLIENFRNR